MRFTSLSLFVGHAGSSITSILLSESEEIYYSNGDGYLTGGGAQYLCMPPNMQWNKYDTTPGDTTAFAWVSVSLRRGQSYLFLVITIRYKS